MKLYGAIASPYVTRVLMFARLKGVDLALENTPGGSPASDDYRALTPIGKIPSLEVDGKVIPESEVICEYIEDMYPDPSGLPADNFDRAVSRTVSRIVDLYWAPPVSGLFRQINPATRDQAVVDEKAAEITKALQRLEKVHQAVPNSFNMRMFFNSKVDEIVKLYSKAYPEEKNQVLQVLERVDPGNITKYNKIRATFGAESKGD